MNKATKRGWLGLLALALVLGFSGMTTLKAQDSTKVFFSEYIEGSGNNKALEIYNSTGVEIDLSKYSVVQASTGGTFAAADVAYKLQLEGVLAAGATYVIANGQADAAILAVADTTFLYGTDPSHKVATFTGNDAVGLFYNDTLIDLIGDPDNDPGKSVNWSVAGVAGATGEHTLVRKPGFTGNATALASFGTDEATSEWIVYPQNTFDYIGSHDFFVKYDVTFQVDMNDAITKKNFVPESHAVVVAGDFNGWNTRKDTLLDVDADGIYAITLQIADGSYGYKFTYSSRQYQPLEWDGDPGRSLVVDGADVNTGVLTPNLEFNDLSAANFADVSIQFEVNMQVQILKGAFDKDNDVLEVRGNMNAWSGGTVLTEGLRPNIFETTLVLKDYTLGSTLEYKFTKTINGETGWEEPLSTDGGNRTFTIEDREYTADEKTEDGYIAIFVNEQDAVPFYNDVTNNDIFTEESTVTFEVDLRPAYYFLADSSGLPADVQNNDKIEAITGLFANGPLLAGGWKAWGVDGLGTMDDYRLYDDGTNGDKVAGDSIFTRGFVFPAGSDKAGVYKFGINGIDNEAFAGENHSSRINDGDVVLNVYGAIKQSNGTVLDGIYDPYIYIDTDNTVTVVRRGGENDGEGTAIEELNPVGTPNEFALNQNYPNPFNPTTTIRFSLANSENVRLTVYNMLGQRVAMLINNTTMGAGQHAVAFDASRLASGAYIYRIEAGSFNSTKKMTLIK